MRGRSDRGGGRRWSSGLLCALVTASVGVGTRARADEEPPLTRIAFGSCFRATNPHDVWSTIEAFRPELLLLLGDNVYADTEDEEELRAAWAELEGVPAFQSLRLDAALLATWDDHDYGLNDGGADFPARALSQQVFLDFLEVPQADPRRGRAGVYHAEVFGPPGRRVQVILMDTRYHRSPLELRESGNVLGDGLGGRYRPSTDPEQTMLGEVQWAWLAERLAEPAELRLVVSSIQVVSEDHGFESWSRLPRERERLTRTIRDAGAEGVVLLSGDRHMAELSVLDLARTAPHTAVDVGYPLVDVTSSSLNAPMVWNNGVNRHRVGTPYFGSNFGTIEIDWSVDPRLVLSIRDERGTVVIHHALRLSELER